MNNSTHNALTGKIANVSMVNYFMKKEFFTRTSGFLAIIFFLEGCYFPLVATGVVATAVAVTDRRTAGIILEDETIELKSMNELSKNYPKEDISVAVTSFNRAALLTGWVSSEELSKEVASLIANVENVREIINELNIGPKATRRMFARDTILTAKIKTSFIDEEKLNANVVKVKTENGIVFLMGMVTQREADLAADIASRVKGTKRVVKVFEVKSEIEIANIDAIINSQKPKKPLK